MCSATAELVEVVAQRLYRQHRARNGHPEPEWGEWDRAGSLQNRFRDDARDILSVLPRQPRTPQQPATA